MSSSIIFRMGADNAGLKKDLQAAEKMVAQSAQKHGTAAVAAHEHMTVSSHRVAARIGAFSQTLLSGGSAAQVFVAGMEGIERSMHLPLGALAGLAIGAVVAEEIHKVVTEAEKLNKEIDKVFAGSQQGRDLNSMEVMKTRLEEIRKIAAKIKDDGHQEGEGLWASMGKELHKGALEIGKFGHGDFSSLLAGIGGRKSSVDTDEEGNQEKIAKARKLTLDYIADGEERINELTRIRLASGDHEAEIEKIKLESLEKQGDLKAAAQPGENIERQLAAIRDAEHLAIEGARRKEAAIERTEALEARILAIKMAGRDVAVETGRAQLAAAQEELRLATGEHKPAAQNKVDAAELSTREAEKARDKEIREAWQTEGILQAQAGHHETIAAGLQVEAQFAEKIRAAKEAHNEQLVTALEHEKQVTLELKAQAIAQKRREQSQLSLHELATEGHGKARATAREIERLEKMAKHSSLHGTKESLGRAKGFHDRAEELKRHFAPLKDSEKDLGGALKGALDDAAVLKEIAKNTKGAGKVR